MENIKLKSIMETILNEDEIGLINEASFSAGKLKKVSDLLASIIGKGFGGEFKLLGAGLGKETFKKKSLGQGEGYRYINNNGYMIRFGWLKKAKKSKYQINIVDFWEPKSKATWDTPTITVKLADWMNVIEVAKELKQVLITGEVSESIFLNEEGQEILLESAPKKMISYAKEKGYEYEGESEYKLIAKMGSDFNKDEYKGFTVIRGEKEKNSSEEIFKDNEKLLKEKKWSDPDLIFDDIEKLTTVVATGGANGLIVAGMAGLGKTFHVEKTMKDLMGSPEGPTARWRHTKGGKLSPYGLYMELFRNRDDMVLVYDDTDLWGDKDSVAMLKAAMDTYDVRKITWNSKATVNTDLMSAEEKDKYYEELYTAMIETPEEVGGKIKLPASFNFTSRIIFITNVNAAKFDKDPHMAAVKSRSYFMDVQLKREDIVRRIKSILPFMMPEIDMKIKEEVVDQLAAGGHILTMRAVTKAIGIRMGGASDWERLTREYA